MKTQEKLADVQQGYETLGIVVSRALGGGKDKDGWTPPPKADPSTAPRSFEELEARMNAALGG